MTLGYIPSTVLAMDSKLYDIVVTKIIIDSWVLTLKISIDVQWEIGDQIRSFGVFQRKYYGLLTALIVGNFDLLMGKLYVSTT